MESETGLWRNFLHPDGENKYDRHPCAGLIHQYLDAQRELNRAQFELNFANEALQGYLRTLTAREALTFLVEYIPNPEILMNWRTFLPPPIPYTPFRAHKPLEPKEYEVLIQDSMHRLWLSRTLDQTEPEARGYTENLLKVCIGFWHKDNELAR